RVEVEPDGEMLSAPGDDDGAHVRIRVEIGKDLRGLTPEVRPESVALPRAGQCDGRDVVVHLSGEGDAHGIRSGAVLNGEEAGRESLTNLELDSVPNRNGGAFAWVLRTSA